VSELEKRPSDRYRLNGDFVDLSLRLGLLGLLIYWSFVLVRPFIPILIWSIVLAVALYPVHDWSADRLGGRRGLAAVLITVLSLFVFIGPAIWLGFGLVEGVEALSERLGSGSLTIPPAPQAIKGWPLVGAPAFEFWDLAATNLTGALAKIAPQLKQLGGSLLGMAGSAGVGVLMFLASVIVAGFLFVPGPSLVRAIKAVSSRVDSARGGEFVELAGATIRTVSRGIIGISVLQALLAGIGFKLAGVPGASMLTFLVLAFGIGQLGSVIVMIPVIIWGWTVMETTSALLLTVYLVIVGLLDNILKPIVMGRGLTTPMLVILIGVIGGTIAHGIIGLFIGPIVLAVAWELLAAWMRE
jgi:predicted PurR-regulated permease PerM